MGYDPPGLEERPDDATLAGFGSLMGEANTPPPGFLKTAITLPIQLVKLLLSIPLRLLRLPGRLLRRGRDR